MNLFDYQQLAARTIPANLNGERLYLNAVLGANGEAGEMADMEKKATFQGHTYTLEQKVKEIGDCLWYLAAACTALGISLELVAQANIDKLQRRYPDGFTTERSVNRDDGPASLNAVRNEHIIEPVAGVNLNEWHWWNDEPIRLLHYPQQSEGLTRADHTDGVNV